MRFHVPISTKKHDDILFDWLMKNAGDDWNFKTAQADILTINDPEIALLFRLRFNYDILPSV